jgi:hypothetical protein
MYLAHQRRTTEDKAHKDLAQPPSWRSRHIEDICRHHRYDRIELIYCNKLGIQSVASIALVVTLPLYLYKEGKDSTIVTSTTDTIASFQSGPALGAMRPGGPTPNR